MENNNKLTQEEKELLDCIHNLMGFFDTPIARMKLKGENYEEVRKTGRKILEKYNIKTTV